MKISYGTSDFATLRRKGQFYVDKTPFLPELENDDLGFAYLMFLRPRRFGKSLLVSMMEHYYDKAKAGQFDELFRGLWVYDHPTPEKNKFLVLKLDFSQTGAATLDSLHEGFLQVVRGSVQNFFVRYGHLHPNLMRLDERLLSHRSASGIVAELCATIGGIGEKLYVMIDEYDTFGTALLSTGQTDLYSTVTDKTGFVREFYQVLKAGAGSGAIGRFFLTGGTPILLDDLVSGFNIVTNISLFPQFNALAGFTKSDVVRAVDEFLRTRPSLATIEEVLDRDAFVARLEALYDGYRFAEDARERIFNSTMVLYFLRTMLEFGKYPRQTLDPNARTDYRKLHGLWASTGPAAEERRAVLETVLQEGCIQSELVEQFGRRTGATTAQFVSLMYYTGMLTLSEEPIDFDQHTFVTPNQVIRELSWDHYARLLEDLDGVRLSDQPISQALRAMAQEGTIDAMLEVLHKHVLTALSIKDFPRYNEKSMKMLLMGMILTSGVFHVLSEREFNQGLNDLFLSPSVNLRTAKCAWMLELKYLKSDERDNLETVIHQAEQQLEKYLSDKQLVPMLSRGLEIKAGTLVFIGCKEVQFRAYGVY